VGRAVVDRVVEPLLGGVYAGRTDRLSLRATVPALWQRARVGGTLLDTPPPLPPGPAGPVFAGLRGGVGRLPQVLAERLAAAGVEVRTRTTVRGLRRTPSGWRLETGSAAAPSWLDADQVVLAVPVTAAGRLLTDELPLAALELAAVETASVVVVAAAFDREDLEGLTGSGLLVPPVEGTLIKAATYSSLKWAWVSDRPGDPLVLRLSAGRAGETRPLQRDDAELTAVALADLNRILGPVLGRALTPIETAVTRWGGGLPQYAPGHLDRIARTRAAVAGTGVAVCGAAFDGVGVPACIAAAEAAVATLDPRATCGPSADLPAGGPAAERTITA
jgi:oxygen-dependent protoporphyrinogen oxidase